jgi:hypothetical protein
MTFVSMLFILISFQNINAWPEWSTSSNPPKTSFLTSVKSTLISAYWWKTPDKALPTFNQLNVVTFTPVDIPSDTLSQNLTNTPTATVLKHLKKSMITQNVIINGRAYKVQNGIPNSFREPVSVYSGGYSNHGRPYAYSGYNAIKAGLVPETCVTFEFPTDTRRGFNFCQEQDLKCLELVCKKIVKKSPEASIILHGACKGAANNLRFLAESAENNTTERYVKNIKAVIAESPPLSVEKALQHTFMSCITLPLIPHIFPNYNSKAKTIMNAKKFPKIPVLVASLPHDTISDLKDVRTMNKHLTDIGGTITHFVSKETKFRHGKIGRTEDYRSNVSSFLKNIKQD